jgi:hypothetical protein
VLPSPIAAGQGNLREGNDALMQRFPALAPAPERASSNEGGPQMRQLVEHRGEIGRGNNTDMNLPLRVLSGHAGRPSASTFSGQLLSWLLTLTSSTLAFAL